jgi:hypothetical protein
MDQSEERTGLVNIASMGEPPDPVSTKGDAESFQALLGPGS